MRLIKDKTFNEERALFCERDLVVVNTSFFGVGESPLKESANIELDGCTFGWKYPLWYSKNIRVKNTTLLETARSGVWYTEDISFTDCTVAAPKTFRRSGNIALTRVKMPMADETLWSCRDLTIDTVEARGDYFAMNCERVSVNNLDLFGNYAFDGCRDIEVRNSRLMSKDAFWNCENVTVYNSVINGEYLGWNSKNVRFVGCTIESNQGMCYMDGVVLIDCVLVNTDLAFEYSRVDADISSSVDSVKNPEGRIVADAIGEIIVDGNKRGDAEIIERCKKR